MPHPSLLPVPETPPARDPATEAQSVREHPPRDAALKDEDYAGEGRPVRNPRPATFELAWLGWQQRVDDHPQLVWHQLLHCGARSNSGASVTVCRAHQASACCGDAITPNCCLRLIMSNCPRNSTILPPTIR